MTPDLKHFACLADLSEDDAEVFAAVLKPVALQPGEQVFVEGDEADGMLLLVTGRLRLERAGKPTLTGEVGAGAALGALSLLVPGPREASVFAETRCSALWLSRAAYRRAADDAPRAACQFLERLLTDFASMVRPALSLLAEDAVDPSADDQ